MSVRPEGLCCWAEVVRGGKWAEQVGGGSRDLWVAIEPLGLLRHGKRLPTCIILKKVSTCTCM